MLLYQSAFFTNINLEFWRIFIERHFGKKIVQKKIKPKLWQFDPQSRWKLFLSKQQARLHSLDVGRESENHYWLLNEVNYSIPERRACSPCSRLVDFCLLKLKTHAHFLLFSDFVSNGWCQHDHVTGRELPYLHRCSTHERFFHPYQRKCIPSLYVANRLHLFED